MKSLILILAILILAGVGARSLWQDAKESLNPLPTVEPVEPVPHRWHEPIKRSPFD